VVVGRERPRPERRAALRDEEATERAVRVGGELGRRLLDRVVAGAVGRRREGDQTDVSRRRGKSGQRRSLPAAVCRTRVEAVVRVPAAPTGRDDDVARVFRVDREVIDDVLVRRVRVGRARPAGQVGRVRREHPRPWPVQVGQRVGPGAAAGRGPHGGADEPELADDRALQLGPADPVGRGEGPAAGVAEHVDAGADERGGAGVGLAGRVPEPARPVEAQVAGGRRGQLLGDRRPMAAAGGRAPDAAVGRPGVHVAVVVRGQAGDAPGDQAGAAGGVALHIAVARVVRVVGQPGDVGPAAAGVRQALLLLPRGGVRAGRHDAGRRPRLGPLLGLFGDLFGVLATLVAVRLGLEGLGRRRSLGGLLFEVAVEHRTAATVRTRAGRGDRGDDQGQCRGGHGDETELHCFSLATLRFRLFSTRTRA